MLEKFGVQDASNHMASAHADSLALEAVFVAPQLLAQLSGAVEEAASAGQWVDAHGHLPPAIGPRDAASLLLRCLPEAHQGRPFLKVILHLW